MHPKCQVKGKSTRSGADRELFANQESAADQLRIWAKYLTTLSLKVLTSETGATHTCWRRRRCVRNFALCLRVGCLPVNCHHHHQLLSWEVWTEVTGRCLVRSQKSWRNCCVVLWSQGFTGTGADTGLLALEVQKGSEARW